MPCYYTGTLEGDRLLAEQESKERVQKKLIKLTQMLCSICTEVEKHNSTWEKEDGCCVEMSDELKKWWIKHKKIDEKRKKNERRSSRSV